MISVSPFLFLMWSELDLWACGWEEVNVLLWIPSAVWEWPHMKETTLLSLATAISWWFNTTSFVFAPGMIALDRDGHVAAGTSTNGMTHKVPGYVDYIESKVCKNVFFSWLSGNTCSTKHSRLFVLTVLISKIRALSRELLNNKQQLLC